MNRKIIFSIITSISLIVITSCTTVPAVSNNTSTNTISTSESMNTTAVMDPNLACSAGQTSANTTVELTEGPYYTPGSPEDASLYKEGMTGIKLIVTGYVYDTNCQPVANAWLDFWQADANGVYDNSGYTLRGHQYTDSTGRFELVTVVPGIYPGRTEHIHFKVQAPNGNVITSQLFFPGVTQNDSDGIYDDSLLLSIQETSDGLLGQYNFVVPTQ